MIDTILVVQGPELKSVKRGLTPELSQPKLLSLPIGAASVTRYLNNWQKRQDFSEHQPSTILVMGLCGSLSSQYQPGDVVIYNECVEYIEEGRRKKEEGRRKREEGREKKWMGTQTNCKHHLDGGVLNPKERDYSELPRQKCDSVLTAKLQTHLKGKASLVTGLTSDRFIYKAAEKQLLGKNTGAEVVDMEGVAILNFFARLSIPVAMVRVVSDDCYHDLPNITSALTSSGSLQPLALAIAMFRQPLPAFQLIRGSIQGLKVLQEVTSCLFND
ncbi:MAG: nucleoside phosphorylase [Okeania sp. SIO3B5]|uniref:5'-methylthioadenosine/S-adenosylhomocysteine nucleosidase family protein n=1 Tax=Okeania sp. SIO3B5 TaxID=2607811 RepID=UPI0013FF83DD|nr:phosphorylase [Okeania sp. SIO3B5]NEO55427.1 nucleoside phosphorylase [Okeania sp. SIO3B5]